MRHARMFFNRPDYDLSSAAAGSFAFTPTTEMIEALSRNYSNTTAMIFRKPPEFGDIPASITRIEHIANGNLSVDASERDAMPDSVTEAPQWRHLHGFFR